MTRIDCSGEGQPWGSSEHLPPVQPMVMERSDRLSPNAHANRRVEPAMKASLDATVCREAERSGAERQGSLCGQPGRLA
jgi:hypothetical protein